MDRESLPVAFSVTALRFRTETASGGAPLSSTPTFHRLPREGIETRDLSENAQTINEQGVTIVPLDVRVLDDGDVYIRAKDPAYATPGPDEAQKFND